MACRKGRPPLVCRPCTIVALGVAEQECYQKVKDLSQNALRAMPAGFVDVISVTDCGQEALLWKVAFVCLLIRSLMQAVLGQFVQRTPHACMLCCVSGRAWRRRHHRARDKGLTQKNAPNKGHETRRRRPGGVGVAWPDAFKRLSIAVDSCST